MLEIWNNKNKVHYITDGCGIQHRQPFEQVREIILPSLTECAPARFIPIFEKVTIIF